MAEQAPGDHRKDDRERQCPAIETAGDTRQRNREQRREYARQPHRVRRPISLEIPKTQSQNQWDQDPPNRQPSAVTPAFAPLDFAIDRTLVSGPFD
jgi:hypothetical protein